MKTSAFTVVHFLAEDFPLACLEKRFPLYRKGEKNKKPTELQKAIKPDKGSNPFPKYWQYIHLGHLVTACSYFLKSLCHTFSVSFVFW